MTDDPSVDSDSIEPKTEDLPDATPNASTTYKVLGEFADDSGAGVLGKNTAGSGTPIGVEGAVPNASGGYGLSTPDDANVGGTLTAGTVDGSLAADLVTLDAIAQNGASSGDTFVWDGSQWTTGSAAGGKWRDADANDLLEPNAGYTGIDLSGVSNSKVVASTVDTAGADFVVETGTTASTDASSVVLGHEKNSTNGTVGAVIGGGGKHDGSGTVRPNVVFDDYGVVGGGLDNQAGATNSYSWGATVGGGQGNTARETFSFVGGGEKNTADAEKTTVGGGLKNDATGTKATVAGGENNSASGEVAGVGGGFDNTASADLTTVGGGAGNTASAAYAIVGGGRNSVAEAKYATVGGGGPSDTSSPGAVDATRNVVHDDYGTVGGGGNNRAGVSGSTTASFATVAGGNANTVEANAESAAVGGGENNLVDSGSSYATVSGGTSNAVLGSRGTVGGGKGNTAGGQDATVAGGQDCVADGNYSFAAGRLARAGGNDGAFVFGDSSSTSVTASATDQVVFQAGGSRTSGTAVEVYSQSDGSAGVKLAANDGTWQSLSSRAAKTDVEPVAGPDVLDAVQQLDVSTWRYDGQDESVRHMGPMAGEFHDVFGLGTDEETVAALDLAGVALAAIQGLSRKLAEKDDRIEALATENERLRERLAEVEQLRDRLAGVEDRLERTEGVGGESAVADD